MGYLYNHQDNPQRGEGAHVPFQGLYPWIFQYTLTRPVLYLFYLLFLIFFFLGYSFAEVKNAEIYPDSRGKIFSYPSPLDLRGEAADSERNILQSGWYFWDPYQYVETSSEGSVLTGLDIELQKLILAQAGFGVNVPEVSWKQHLEDLETGKRDVGMGAFYSKRREEFNYLAGPYRFEEDSFFVLKKNLLSNDYRDVQGFLNHVRKNNLVVGVTDGYLYANNDINKFIDDPENTRYIVKVPNDLRKLNLLMANKIDGFLADRIAGATVIWRQKLGQFVAEKRIEGAKAPIYMLLSRKTVSQEEFQKINDSIKYIKRNNEYNKVVSWYLYPVILLETTSSYWFYMIEMIGILAFALSGLVVGYRHEASLLGTFILALLPSFGGGVIRDLLVGRFPVWFLQADQYIILVLIVVGIGFFIIRHFKAIDRFLYHRCKIHFLRNSDKGVDKFLLVTDAIGLATFTVTGVLVCMIGKTNPLWLWGPVFAFLSGAGGGMLRDFIVKGDKNERIAAINGQLYGEISIVWGAFLSLYLFFNVNDVDPSNIKISVIVTIFMCFLTRIAIYWLRIPNMKISLLSKVNEEK